MGAAIGSVLNQTYQDFEIVVVNDGSTDGTETELARCGDERVLVISQENQGLSAARNVAIDASVGRYLVLLDSDASRLPAYLERAASTIPETNNIGFAYTDAYAFDAAGRVRLRTMTSGPEPGTTVETRNAFLLDLIRRNFVFVSAVIARDAFVDVGPFDEVTRAAEDYQLWLNVAAAGYPILRIPGVNALYRVHPHQMSQDRSRLLRGELHALQSVNSTNLPSVHRELLARRLTETAHELRKLEAHENKLIYRVAARARQTLQPVKRAIGLGEQWSHTTPHEVADAYPDLTAL